MDEYTIMGVVLGALITLCGFYLKVKDDIKKDQKSTQEPINRLNISIIELTAEIRHMREDDEVRNKRIEKHGKEIDKLEEKAVDHDKRLADHESRIKGLEKNR